MLYEPGGRVNYLGDVLFAFAHDAVESQANEVLSGGEPAGGAQFIALGSNEYGHCLCLIRQVS